VLKVAYLANRFPVTVEPYVGEEIEELRRRGVDVIAGSARQSDESPVRTGDESSSSEILYLQPVRVLILLRAFLLILRRWERIADLITLVLMRGKESPKRRLKALLHTWLGACYTVQLRARGVDHIHVHHGYFGSWIAMVAARLLAVDFSLTLHGSDLLRDAAYLSTKLENCRFCVTISEYNRHYILRHFPGVDRGKIVVSRLGVEVPARVECLQSQMSRGTRRTLTLLAVGRLHAVKNHSFLVRACANLRDRGLDFECLIAGEGPERQLLERLIQKNRLRDRFTLLGHVSRTHMGFLYQRADVVVLTSRSEGLPLVLMEAMVRGRLVLAPAITGIPEIVIPGKTGFLYEPAAIDDFVGRILFLRDLIRAEDRCAMSRLAWIRHAARVQVLHNFNRQQNLDQFCNRFLDLIAHRSFATEDRSTPDENLVLQQIQLPI